MTAIGAEKTWLILYYTLYYKLKRWRKFDMTYNISNETYSISEEINVYKNQN